MPPDITRRLMTPFIEYSKKTMQLEVQIPLGDCDAYERYKAMKEALVMPSAPLWQPLLEKGYKPFVESSNRSGLVIFGRNEITNLQTLRGKRFAFDARYKDIYQARFDDVTSGIWNTMDLIPVTNASESVIKVLNSEADFGMVGRPIWGLTAASVKEKLFTFPLASKNPILLLMSHPHLSDQHKQNYKNIFLKMHNDDVLKQWMNNLNIGQFIASDEKIAARIAEEHNDQPINSCWKK